MSLLGLRFSSMFLEFFPYDRLPTAISMPHCFTPGLTCLDNVYSTSSQGGFEADTLLLRCSWEVQGSLSSSNNSEFVNSTEVPFMFPVTLFKVPGCACSHSHSGWLCLSKCRERALTGLVSRPDLVKCLKTKDQSGLPSSNPAAACPYSNEQAIFSSEWEPGVETMEALCEL